MLSAEQVDALAAKINEKVNIPLLSEKKEEKILEDILTKIDDAVGDALPPELQQVWNNLDDGISAEEQQQITEKLLPILNEKINIPLLGENAEEKIFEKILDALFKVVNEGLDKMDDAIDS